MWWLSLLSHRNKVLTLTAPSGQGLSMCRFCGRKHPERAHTKTYNYWLIGDSKLSIDVSPVSDLPTFPECSSPKKINGREWIDGYIKYFQGIYIFWKRSVDPHLDFSHVKVRGHVWMWIFQKLLKIKALNFHDFVLTSKWIRSAICDIFIVKYWNIKNIESISSLMCFLYLYKFYAHC